MSTKSIIFICKEFLKFKNLKIYTKLFFREVFAHTKFGLVLELIKGGRVTGGGGGGRGG